MQEKVSLFGKNKKRHKLTFVPWRFTDCSAGRGATTRVSVRYRNNGKYRN